MIYENPRYPDALILEGYASAENAGHDSQYAMRVNSFERALRSLSTKVPSLPARVLDVGCAGGAFVEAAGRCGYHCVGLEPSRELAAAARGRGLDVDNVLLEAHSFEPRSFDMITFWDVLEHVPDPKALLRIAGELLRPDGVLLINFPDIGTLPAKLTGKRFWWAISVHLHHFTKSTATELCRRTGFETYHIQPYWQTLEFGYLQDLAVHFGIPLSKLFRHITPGLVKTWPVPYWASQTTLLARIR
jgi:SAM-dependent methyltransferase